MLLWGGTYMDRKVVPYTVVSDVAACLTPQHVVMRWHVAIE